MSSQTPAAEGTETHAAAAAAPDPLPRCRVNDVAITVATQNGTGSQTANQVLVRTIFKMGVPVSGKSIYPSNIAGLPSWYNIRANGNGWIARAHKPNILVAMNEQTVEEDFTLLKPGAIVILNDQLSRFAVRNDVTVYHVPFTQIVESICPEPKLRKLVTNMVYVGMLAYMLELELDEVNSAISFHFAEKVKARDLNIGAALAGYQWAEKNWAGIHPFTIRRMNANENKIMIDGNTASAIGLLFGGITVLAWYPISPSSDLCENLTDYLNKYRRDPETGKATFAVVQAEDELASIAMVVGASWAGARAATATSGPGLSLMSEIAGLSYFTENPAVIVNVQRMGPSTGLPTRTSQGDMLMGYVLSHGDCKHILLIPSTPTECYEFSMQALDLADRLQTLVLVMLDLDLGINSWITDEFTPPTKPIDRGKILDAEDLERVKEFARYRDVDGDGIPYRTLPGTPHPKAAFYTRGTGHTDTATYSELTKHWTGNLDRLSRKFDSARDLVPAPDIQMEPGARVALIAYGTSDLAAREACSTLTEQGVPASYMRIKALPPCASVRSFIEQHDVVYVVDQNRDAQMATILQMEFPDIHSKLRQVRHYNGIPIDAINILRQIPEFQKEKVQ